MGENDARLAYELAVGKRVSDNHWYRTRRLIQRHQLEVSTKTVQFFATLRKKLPRSAIGVNGILECYKQAEELLSGVKEPIKGSDVLDIFGQYGICPHQSTISRWFSSIGGYRRDRLYKPEELKDILALAFIYKAQHSTKLPEAN